MWRRLTAWARTHHREQTPYERALRLLWSPQVLEISDEEFVELGRVLGLEEPQPHNTVEPQPHNTVTTRQKAQVTR